MPKFDNRESIVLENYGQKIFGILHRPLKQSKKYPVVLICHGLAGHKVGKYRIYVILAELLAKIGIASFRIDFRGSGDSEGDFGDMTIEGEVSDALIALEYLKKVPDMDPDRIGIFGRSMGGTVALLATHSDVAKIIKSIVIWAPIFDGHQWLEKWKTVHKGDLKEEDQKAMMRINGQIPGFEFFKQLFDMKMIDELKTLDTLPFLHIHGEQDAQVSIEHANRFVKYRGQSKGKTKFIRLPHSDHDFSHPQEQEQALTETCVWFQHTL